MNRVINIIYAILCIVLYAYLVVFVTAGGTEISSDAQFIGMTIIIAGCLAYGGND